MNFKLKMPTNILEAIKKFSISLIITTKSKYYDNSNKLVIGKMKYETRAVAIEKCFGMKPKMCSFLVGKSE